MAPRPELRYPHPAFARASSRGLLLACLAMPALAAPLGCAAGGSRGPREALREYALALRERRVEDAYALLSRDARARVSFADFSRMVRENAREIEDISASLLGPAEPPKITATLTSPDGEALLLVYENDAWHVDGSAFDLYGQSTPRAALESFVRAFDNKRYDVLLRFVPEEKRQGLTAEQLKQAWEGDQRPQVERLTQALKASLPNLHIEVLGTRATVAYGPGGNVELIQEQGTWRIEDF
ncbi:MAG TPA: hypothetical protein VFS67_18335 [Polyangiaceae bacterium]|nr:hypothetical protein [Polyangiaceae bacterium]